MSGWAIVAIPQDSDPVWNYSSEDIPHMTLLFLGEQNEKTIDLEQVALYIQHVAETTLRPFYMQVDSRGLLGSEDADVLFFKKNKIETKMMDLVRSNLLANAEIFKAYSSVDQYPEWTPHLTLGYPNSPAKKNTNDNPASFWSVEFDRIALWTGEFTGPTFKLEYPEREEQLDMAMGDKTEEFFAHFGVKGMHWGRRKAEPNRNEELIVRSAPAKKAAPFSKEAAYRRRNADTAVTVTTRPNTRLTSKGGSNIKPHPDAVRSAAAKRIAKSSTTDALSTKDLQELVSRMNLEQQYSKLTAPQTSVGRKFVNNLLQETAKTEAQKAIKKKLQNNS